MTQTRVRAALAATMVVFGLSGLAFASWAARIPAASSALGLTEGATGILLIMGAISSVITLPLAGPIAARIGTANTVRLGAIVCAVGALVMALGLSMGSFAITATGLFIFGAGIALWDVSQNIEGAEVERLAGKTYMPKMHAAFSAGAVVGALLGGLLTFLGVPLPAHLAGLAVIEVVVIAWATTRFLPIASAQKNDGDAHLSSPSGGEPRAKVGDAPSSISKFAAWREPRILAIGVMVLGAAITEGAANDWIAKATVTGLGQSEAIGAMMFAVFVGAMTVFRYVGGGVVDRFGRQLALYVSFVVALVGLVIFVLSPWLWLAVVGAALWGFGAALGFPVGMSAAADDPARAAGRVSVIATIGYTAFLAGPPLLGFLGDHWGIRNALLVIAVPMLLSMLLVRPAVKPPVDAGRREKAETGPLSLP